jgi:ParB/RepB/Spo0J family partition protein
MSTEYTTTAAAVNVPLAEIVRGDNDRDVFDPAELQELAASLVQYGLKQPITVRPVAPRQLDGHLVKYEIVAGERRFRAAGLAGWATIPAFIEAMSDEADASVMFLENMHRVELDAIEEGRVYDKWMRKFAWDLDRIVKESGKKLERVQKRLALLQLIPEVQQLVRSGAMPIAHAEALAWVRGAGGITALGQWSQGQAIKALGNAAKMPAIGDWRVMCGELLAAGQQSTMFDLDGWAQAIEQGVKRIKPTGLARHPKMPKLVANKNTGQSLRQYIADLEAAGLATEALAISHVLDELVKGNLTTL